MTPTPTSDPLGTRAVLHAHHRAPDRPGHGPATGDDTRLAELLDLDAILGLPVLKLALDAASAALGAPARRVVDLGAGTGTGTLAIADRFPHAEINSVDASPTMLERLRAAAAAAGVAHRVKTHRLDLDGDWLATLTNAADLVWAALSLHHVSDPEQVLRQAWGALRPGGVLVVTEFTGATRYDPGDLGTGRGGLGQRLVSALAAHGYPVTAEWTTALTRAGFAPVERIATAMTASARTADGARYLGLQLSQNGALVTGDLSADDLVALDVATAALAAGTSELALSSGRAVWVAVRPMGTKPAVAPEADSRIGRSAHEPRVGR